MFCTYSKKLCLRWLCWVLVLPLQLVLILHTSQPYETPEIPQLSPCTMTIFAEAIYAVPGDFNSLVLPAKYGSTLINK